MPSKFWNMESKARYHPETANDNLLLKLFSEVLRWGLIWTPHLHTIMISLKV